MKQSKILHSLTVLSILFVSMPSFADSIQQALYHDNRNHVLESRMIGFVKPAVPWTINDYVKSQRIVPDSMSYIKKSFSYMEVADWREILGQPAKL